MTGPGQPSWVPNFVRLVPAVVELLAFLNHDTRTDGRTDGHTDGHNVINNIDTVEIHDRAEGSFCT